MSGLSRGGFGAFTQLFINIIYYVLFINIQLVVPSMYGFENVLRNNLIVFSTPILIVISTFLLRSVLLALLNSILLLYVVEPTLLSNPINSSQLLLIYIGSLIASLLLMRLFKISDELLNYVKTVEEKSFKTDASILLSNYALLYASASITLPLISLLINLLINDAELVYKHIDNLITLLPLNISISMIMLIGIDKPLYGLLLGSLSSLGPWSTLVLISLSIRQSIFYEKPLVEPRIFLGESVEGIYLGVAKAVLSYGYPSRLYRDIKQDVEARDRVWYWRELEKPLTIDPGRLQNKHVVIVGSSGSGKSLLAKHLLLEYYNKYNHLFIVFDPHNEYSYLAKYINNLQVLDASRLGLNPLELGRLNPRERAHQLSSIVMSLFHLGHLQRQALEDLFIQTYEYKGIYVDQPDSWVNKPPEIRDVLDVCNKLMAENELYRRIYPYIRILADNVFSSSSFALSDILDKPIVIALNNLKSDYVRVLYVDTFLQRLLDMMYRRELVGNYIVVLDEAYTLLTRDYSKHVVSRLLMESRKYGVGVVFITQHPLSIPEPIIDNSAVKISFNISEPRSLDYVSRIFSGVVERDRINVIKNALRNLKSLYYVLSISGLDEVYIVSEEDVADTILGKG